VADEFVSLKYVGREKSLSMHAEFGKPFVFEPYLRLPVATYVKWANLFAFTGEILLVTPEEYDAWAEKKAAAEAEKYFCGTYGGLTNAGEFCGKQVEGPGCRCEHHGGNDPDLQGKYEKVDVVPKKINKGGRPRKTPKVV
jgi:hypothetical protein